MSKSEIQEQIMDIKTLVEQKLCYGSTHHPICQELTKLYRVLEGCVCEGRKRLKDILIDRCFEPEDVEAVLKSVFGELTKQ